MPPRRENTASISPRVSAAAVSDGAARRKSTLTRASSSFGWNGLAMKSSAPASKAFSLSSNSVRPVKMIMGILAVSGRWRRRRHSSYPSMSGIITSRIASDGCAGPIAASASSPLTAAATSKPSAFNTPAVSFRFISLSSTTKILVLMLQLSNTSIVNIAFFSLSQTLRIYLHY